MVRYKRPQQSDGSRSAWRHGGCHRNQKSEDKEMKKETAEIIDIIQRSPELALRVLTLALEQAKADGILLEDGQRFAQSA